MGQQQKIKCEAKAEGLAGRKIMNDNLGEDFKAFLTKACANMLRSCKGAVYICMSSSELDTLQSAFRNSGGKWSTFIIWAKNTFSSGVPIINGNMNQFSMAGKMAMTIIGVEREIKATCGFLISP